MSLTTCRAVVLVTLACCLAAAAATSVSGGGEVVVDQQHPPLRRDRRASSFVRIGKSKLPLSTPIEADESSLSSSNADEENFAEKRASSFVRIGKSMSGMPEDSHVVDYETDSRPFKRSSSFVRIGRMHAQTGKSSEGNRKRQSSFVRIGKSVPYETAAEETSDLLDDEEEPKLDDYLQQVNEAVPDKKASSFVRIGRSAASKDEDQ